MSVEYDNFKEQVKSAADILEVVSGYVALKKRGSNYWGCCPFHGEKTPSFSVQPSKGFFYCFGCHEGGDVIKFIMKIENCEFQEALKLLADKYNIAVPENQHTAQELANERKAKGVFAVNELAGKYFEACLTKTRYGSNALQYLHNRGITDEIIKQFSIGYALDSFSGLLHNLAKRGVKETLLAEAGLVLPGKTKGFYDKFRNRVMIPIKDARGRIVGFGGRVIDKGEPKYLNTGETRWFNKRNILFGFDVAKDEIKSKKYAIVVEGYMDAISLHAVGINNVVASMGTAFAMEQAKLLRRMAEEVIFCYDSDNAGRKASMRAVGIATKEGLKVKIAGVPSGKDPDEFVRQYGKEAFLKVLEQAPEGLDFLLEETIKQNNVNDFAGKAQVVSNIVPFLLECKNEIEVAGYISKIAQRLTLDEGLIANEYNRVAKSKSHIQAQSPAQPKNVGMGITNAEEEAAKILLSILFEHPELVTDCQDFLGDAGFAQGKYRCVYEAFLTQVATGEVDYNRLSDGLDSQGMSVLAEILARDVVEAELEKSFNDCLRIVKTAFLEREAKRHTALALEYSRNQDARYKEELLESQRLQYEIKQLYGN